MGSGQFPPESDVIKPQPLSNASVYPLGKALLGIDHQITKEEALEILGEASAWRLVFGTRMWRGFAKRYWTTLFASAISVVAILSRLSARGSIPSHRWMLAFIWVPIVAYELWCAVTRLDHLDADDVRRRMLRANRCPKCGHGLAGDENASGEVRPRVCSECATICEL